MEKQIHISGKDAQAIADQVRSMVESRTGVLQEFEVIQHRSQNFKGVYTVMKIRVSPVRCIHIEAYQSARGQVALLTGLERERTFSDILGNVAALSDP